MLDILIYYYYYQIKMSSIKRLKNLENQRKALLDELLEIREMIPGSYNEVGLKCGKKNCWCYKDEKMAHISKRITWSESGKSRMKTIPDESVPWIMEMTEKHRTYRRIRRGLRQIDNLYNEALDRMETEIVENTREEKADLWKNPTYKK